MKAHWVLCACKKLEVHDLPGHTRGWRPDTDGLTSALCSWRASAVNAISCGATHGGHTSCVFGVSAVFSLLGSSEAA